MMIIDPRINFDSLLLCRYSLRIHFSFSSHMALLLRQMHVIYAHM
jgi:hypothetical protein